MKLLLLAAILFYFPSNAQTETEWFPSGLNIQPFTANFLEPKAGFSYLLGRSEIRLDIGTSTDIFLHKYNNNYFSVGADLFTYTRLRGESNFHFPVEAIDYFFGINAGYKILCDEKEIGARLRFSHISAHFVDGHFDNRLGTWRDNRYPRTYSREFIELFPYYKINDLRIYLGITYLIHVNPNFIGKGIYQAGFDYFADNVFNSFFIPFVAYDFKLNKIHKYNGNHILTAGVKFGNKNSKGVSLFFSYFSGKSIHGEYFDISENYATAGLNVDI